MVESAQLFKGIHDIPVYTDVFFKKPLRLWVAVPLGFGLVATTAITVILLDSGYARYTLIVGLLATAIATGVGALIPSGRPTIRFRLHRLWNTIKPQLASTAGDPLLAPPDAVIDNLTFSKHGVWAHYLISGLPYYLQSTKRRVAAADLHQSFAREVPAGTWLFGLSVPQDQDALQDAMLRGHHDKPAWVTACDNMRQTIAEQQPRTRIYWLAIPVDAGRAGRSPAGHVAKLRDWVAGRDKESGDSIAAHQDVANDIITALPDDFAPRPVTAAMIGWFWRRNVFRATFDAALPRPDVDVFGEFPVAVFDEGDQQHHRARALPLRTVSAVLAFLVLPAQAAGMSALAVAVGILSAGIALARLAGIRRVPSFHKVLRVQSPDGFHPDSFQAILPVVDMPAAGIQFPGSEFLQALDDLDTGAVFDFAVNLVARNRELEFTRNDRAKGNIDDQFEQRHDARGGDAELNQLDGVLAEYNRQLKHSVDERPLEAAFLVAVGAADPATLTYSVKRLREELSGSGQVAIRHYRGAQTPLWAAFNLAPNHRTGVDQFSQPTTTLKFSRFVPMTSCQVGNSTGILLGFNNANSLGSAVLIDLPAAARRNHTPCCVNAGSPGYGKTYAGERTVRGEVQRGSQVFVVDPGTEWARAFADIDNKAVIDMAGNKFGCDPLRVFPDREAGTYWLDYMVPMMGLDPRSIGVQRLRTILQPQARRHLDITSTAALMRYIASIQAPADGPDTRPLQVAKLADDLHPVLAALQSWASYDYTQAIFDDTLPVPDIANLDLSIWLTGSLDLPTAQEMSTAHLYERLSDRKRASVAIYGMLVRLARVTFAANEHRFGLIVLEEAGALLNSRAGAEDAHLVSRRARRLYTGLLIITQNPIKDLALMGDEFLVQWLIMPFENEQLARDVAAKLGLPLHDLPGVEDYFLAQPSPDDMRDPTAFDEEAAGGAGRRGRQGLGFYVDEFMRKSPIRVAREPDPALHAAYDTTPGRAQ